jgi:prevent-host-death family protein
MNTVGIRELRQRASELLRQVAAGETIEITDRGRPVALLTPLPGRKGLERLRATGEVAEVEGELDDLPEPLDLPAGAETPSQTLANLRASER